MTRLGAREAFLKAKNAVESEAETKSRRRKDPYSAGKSVLAHTSAKRTPQLAEAQRATELLPESKDAFGGPEIAAGVAEVHAILGDNDRAIEILDGLLSRPSAVTGARSESKSDLGPVAKRSAFSSVAEQMRWQNLAGSRLAVSVRPIRYLCVM